MPHNSEIRADTAELARNVNTSSHVLLKGRLGNNVLSSIHTLKPTCSLQVAHTHSTCASAIELSHKMPPPPQPPPEDKRQAAREVLDILHEISTLLVRVSLSVCLSVVSLQGPLPLSAQSSPTSMNSNTLTDATIVLSYQNTHLGRTELSLCVSLIENGVNPEALAV